ncbi:MFS transporter [Pseudokineococcus lusitanus]|uniref:MFS transporter n=1 Tax=Pseudokineococcus lusitanus TaxID=763993 RepID=A0A3N1HLJ9_9ACTN|nr:MFS transporter [Pseudokineococcus lusitanus]ROP43341.1 MFS transporter [Pseudokineococcus lusitanus]
MSTSGTGGLRAYAEVLGTGAASRPFLAAVVARLPIAMAPLGMILLVEEVYGRYALAGLVAGAYAVGVGVGSPVWGRGYDRLGQSRVIAPTVVVSATTLVVLALSAARDAPFPLVVVLALLAGATAPPISSAMRMSWRAVLPRHRWRTGYALDASAVEFVFVGGPVVLALAETRMPLGGPLLLTAALHLTGGLAYAASGPARLRPQDAPPLDGPEAVLADALADDDRAEAVEARPAVATAGRVLTGPVVAVLLVGLVMALSFGFVDTSLVATARELLGDEGRLAVLFAAIAGGSVVGGLTYGALPGSPTERRRVPVLLTGFGTGLLVLALLLGRDGGVPLPLVLVVLFVTGLFIAPGLILQQGLVDGLAPEGRRGESQAWLSTATTAGGAGGTAVAGLLVDVGGPPLALGAGAVAVYAAVVLGVLVQPAWARGLRHVASARQGV